MASSCSECSHFCSHHLPNDLLNEQQMLDKYLNDDFVSDIKRKLDSLRDSCERIRIDYQINRSDDSTPLTQHPIIQKYIKCAHEIDNVLHRCTSSNEENNIRAESNTTVDNMRHIILQQDIDPESLDDNMSMLQQQQNNNDNLLSFLFNLSGQLSINGCETSEVMEQDEQLSFASSAINETNNNPQCNNCKIHRSLDDFNQPLVSTDGCLIWPIDLFRQHLLECMSSSKAYIDSGAFCASIGGPKLWARLSLNKKQNTGEAYLSFYVYMNFPFRGLLTGSIQFILVDQTDTGSLQHIIKSKSSDINHVGDCTGFDDFVNANELFQHPSRYINDEIACFIIVLQQTERDKWAHQPLNVQDALLQSRHVIL